MSSLSIDHIIHTAAYNMRCIGDSLLAQVAQTSLPGDEHPPSRQAFQHILY